MFLFSGFHSLLSTRPFNGSPFDAFSFSPARGVIHNNPGGCSTRPLALRDRNLKFFFCVLPHVTVIRESSPPSLARPIWWVASCSPCVPPPRRRRTFYVYALWKGGTGVKVEKRKKKCLAVPPYSRRSSSIMIIHPPSSSSSILRRVVCPIVGCPWYPYSSPHHPAGSTLPNALAMDRWMGCAGDLIDKKRKTFPTPDESESFSPLFVLS